MSNYPAAIIWDLDGTLVDSALDLAQALNTLLGENGHSAIDNSRVQAIIGHGIAKLIERGFDTAGEALAEPTIQSLVPRFLQIYADCATGNTRPYPGIRPALQHFADAGVRQGVCTNKPESISRQILSSLSLAGYFAAVVGGDTTDARKPDPGPLLACMAVLKATPERSVMIGDSAIDVATARAAGVRVGVVRHGYSRDAVATIGADFVIDQMSVLPGFLGELPRTG